MDQIVKFQEFRDVAGPFNIYYLGSASPSEVVLKTSASFDDLYYGYQFSYADSPIHVRVMSLDPYLTQSSAYYYYPTTTTTTTTSTTTTTTTAEPTTTTSTTTSTTTAEPTTTTSTTTTTTTEEPTTTTSTTTSTTTAEPTTSTTTSTTTAEPTTTTSTTTTTTTAEPTTTTTTTTTTSTTTTTTTISTLFISNGTVTCVSNDGQFTSTISNGTTPYQYVAIDSASVANAVQKVNGVLGAQYQLSFSGIVSIPEGGTWSNVDSTSGTWSGIKDGTWYTAVKDFSGTAAGNATGVSVSCDTTTTTTSTTTTTTTEEPTTTTTTSTTTTTTTPAGLYVTLNTTEASGFCTSTSGCDVVTSPVTGSAVNGTAPYTYLWEMQTDDSPTSISIDTFNDRQTTFSYSGIPCSLGGTTYTGTYKLKVTDAALNVAYSDTVTVTLTNNQNGGCN